MDSLLTIALIIFAASSDEWTISSLGRCRKIEEEQQTVSVTIIRFKRPFSTREDRRSEAGEEKRA
jgi:hypothetical protein